MLSGYCGRADERIEQSEFVRSAARLGPSVTVAVNGPIRSWTVTLASRYGGGDGRNCSRGPLFFVNDDPTAPNGWLVTPDDETALGAALAKPPPT